MTAGAHRIWPFHRLSNDERESTRVLYHHLIIILNFAQPEFVLMKQTDFTNIPISSIFVFHDPRNWALDVQIMTDIICSYPHGLGTPYLATNPAGIFGSKGVELFFCNPDLLWRAQHHVPRFGQGAFKEAFLTVFKVSPQSGLCLPSLMRAIGCDWIYIPIYAIWEAAQTHV